MEIKAYNRQLAQAASHERAAAILSERGQGGWEEQISLSTQVLTGKAQNILTYEHLGKSRPAAGAQGQDPLQRLVDHALGFDRKQFNELETQIQTLQKQSGLSEQERETQLAPLQNKRDDMLKSALERLIGRGSEQT
ncbi:hypothetical protein [Aeromonas diversa]|uniref:hypothetical protein n=1 Tax=Aeromonas diversa TaxID=502790 RepID=UPI003462CACA